MKRGVTKNSSGEKFHGKETQNTIRVQRKGSLGKKD